MRDKLIVANWKAYVTSKKAVADYFRVFSRLYSGMFAGGGAVLSSSKKLKRPRLSEAAGKQKVIICAPYPFMSEVRNALPAGVALGSQDVFWEEKGAYTGEVTPSMLKDAGVSHVIVGHSERRRIFSESDEVVNRKLIAASLVKLMPIVCVGEWEKALSDEDERKSLDFIKNQVQKAFGGIEVGKMKNIVIAYEPVWAISGNAGVADTAENALRMITYIRRIIAQMYDHKTATSLKIIYGGSVSSRNAASFLQFDGIDGVLVGSASADAKEFIQIIRNAQPPCA
jgi:triosephosphate isomerase (TIM)